MFNSERFTTMLKCIKVTGIKLLNPLISSVPFYILGWLHCHLHRIQYLVRRHPYWHLPMDFLPCSDNTIPRHLHFRDHHEFLYKITKKIQKHIHWFRQGKYFARHVKNKKFFFKKTHSLFVIFLFFCLAYDLLLQCLKSKWYFSVHISQNVMKFVVFLK